MALNYYTKQNLGFILYLFEILWSGFGFNAEHNNNNNDQEALLAPVLHQQSTRTITQSYWKETHRRSDTLSGPLYNLYDTKLNLHPFHFLSKIKTKFTGILKPPMKINLL